MKKFKLHPEQKLRATHIFSLHQYYFGVENDQLFVIPKIKKEIE